MSTIKKSVESTEANQNIKELSDREWLLIRGHNIIGSLQPVKQQSFLFNSDTRKFKWEEYQYIPGLVKIINEIIDNSIDVAIKSNFKYANEISIEVGPKKVRVQDNGFGIPVTKGADGTWVPEIAWGRARAGSNFDDDEGRVSAGMNGIGSFATTVFSKKFTGVTDDGKKRLKVQFKNNAEDCQIEEQPSSVQGTTVEFFPDLARFDVEEIDSLHTALIYQRVLNMSIMYPEIRFKFNRRVVKLDAKKFLGMFSTTFEYIEEDNYMIAVFPNEASDFSYHTYVNSLWLEKGGNHVSFLTGKIVDELRAKLIRKYKSIKPGDIKNKVSCIVFFKNFPNAKFDGQTKEFLTNTQKEITSFLDFGNPDVKKDWDRFTTRTYKNKSIIEPIQDLYNAKMLIEENKKLKNATKKQDAPEKYWPATQENKYLFLAEGDSAIGAITAELGRTKNGFFPLKGVPLNVVKDKSKVSKNAEIKQIASILGIDLTTNDNAELEYSNIVIAPDRDVDGSHIAGILTGFFATYTPQYLEQGKVFLFVTPLITVKDKTGIQFMFTMDEYSEHRKTKDPDGNKFLYDYKKGLGSMETEEWSALFEQYQLEELLQPMHLVGSQDPQYELQQMTSWLDDDSIFRKEKILERIKDFDINKV